MRTLVSSRWDYLYLVMTVQLECFVLIVHFIRVFEWTSVQVCKCMGFNYPNFSAF